jgi:hypothetical protein
MRTLIPSALLFGALFTLLGLAFRDQYCMAGPGYGFPFAILHPSHQEWWLLPLQTPDRLDGMAFDPLGLAFNWLSASLLSLIGLISLRRLRPAR